MDLDRVIKLKLLIESNLRQLDNLYESRGDIGGSWSDGDRVVSSSTSHKVENKAIKIVELEETIKNELNAYYEEYNSVKELFSKLPSEEKLIMNLRYLEGLDWKDVAEISNYSIDNCFRLRRKALDRIEKEYYK